jgi:hypothetical protein
MIRNYCLRAAAFAALAALPAAPALAHGVVGDRFFPATIATEDPLAADELALPTIAHVGDETEISAEFTKRITPNLAFSIEAEWTHEEEGGETFEGFQNIETGIKWTPIKDAAHEFALSLGWAVAWGGSGDAEVGAEDTTTYGPSVFFGKGFGGAGAGWLRPLAITGSAEYEAPADEFDDDGERIAHEMTLGLALQYSLPYLNAQVNEAATPDWMDRLTPINEVVATKPVRYAHEDERSWTGSINPGLLWTGKSFQIGAEAIIPLTDESGDDTGFVVQLHVYLDDIFPHSIGRPIFGGRP